MGSPFQPLKRSPNNLYKLKNSTVPVAQVAAFYFIVFEKVHSVHTQARQTSHIAKEVPRHEKL